MTNKLHLAKKILLILVVIIFTIFVFINLKFKNKTKTNITPTNYPDVYYQNLKVGQSTEEEIAKELGLPVNERLIDGKKVLEYKSSNPNFNTELVVESGKLDLVKKIIAPSDNESISNINQQYGNYQNILYGAQSGNGFHLYIIPDKGISYIGNQFLDEVLEIWYFPATNFNTFKQKYAAEFTDSMSVRQ